MSYQHIAAQIFGRSLMIEPQRARTMVSALVDRLNVQSLHMHDGAILERADMQAVLDNWSASGKTLAKTVDGIAVIEVDGTITHKFGHLNPSSGMVGLDGLQALIQSADADPEVRGILLDFNSPGGSVSGTFDLAQLIHDIDTPIWSLVDELCCSAAYALAAATDRIVAPRTAQTGSVGVIAMHENIAGALEQQGREITLITAGARKAEGNSLAPLPDNVHARMQADVDEVYSMFVDSVAQYRGLSADAVRKTEAGVLNAREALELGLIDEIMPAHDALEAFDKTLRRNSNPIRKGMNAMALSLFGRKPKAQASSEQTAAESPGIADQLAAAGFTVHTNDDGSVAGIGADTTDEHGEAQTLAFTAVPGAAGEPLFTEAEARNQFGAPDNAASLDALVELCSEHECDGLAKRLRDRGVTAEQAETIMADVDAIRVNMAATFPEDNKAAGALADQFAIAAHGNDTAQFADALGSLMVEACARMSGEEIDHHQPTGQQEGVASNALVAAANRMNGSK
jgi:signal peptide peptidase SppA